MENENCINEYLKRIDVSRPSNGPTREYLDQLHRGQLTHIPFECFDLIDLKELNISPDYIFDRIVRQRRGGVCYQVNGLFAWILQSFKYNVQMISCHFYDKQKHDYFIDGSHLALYVTLPDGQIFLCDVSFNSNSLTPLFLRPDCVQFGTNGFFRLRKSNDELYYILEKGYLQEGDSISLPTFSSVQTDIVDIDPERFKWTITYKFPSDFSQRSIELKDFESKCPFILHSPDVTLNHRSLCAMFTCQPSIGMRAIIGKEFWTWKTEGGIETREHHPIPDDDQQLRQLLKDKFDLEIERSIKLVGEED